jgi:hypothetical protein
MDRDKLHAFDSLSLCFWPGILWSVSGLDHGLDGLEFEFRYRKDFFMFFLEKNLLAVGLLLDSPHFMRPDIS